MRLKNLRIKNFRGIGDNNGEGISITLFDQNIVFLIGKNNVGKSTILHAYDYLFNDKTSLADDFFNKDCKNFIEIEVELELNESEITDSPLFSKNLIFKRVWKDIGESEVHLGTNGNPPEFIDRKNAKIKRALESLKEKFPEPVWIKGMSSTQEVVSQLQKLIKGAVLDQIEEEHKEDCEEIEQLIQCLQDKMLKGASWTSDLQNRLNQNIQPVFPGLHLEIINEPYKFNLPDLFKQTQVQILDQSKSVKLGLDSQGHGVQRQTILSALKECHKKFEIKSASKDKAYSFEDNNDQQSHVKRKILLLEEPELFLHPSGVRALQRLLYELADNSPFQLICATHSPIMVDLARPHSSLVRVEKTDNVVLLHQLNTDIDLKDGKELLTMIRSFNPYICESFFSDCVILVEGPTESVVLNVLLDKLRTQRDEKDYLEKMESIAVVECGGKGTIPLFQKILRSFKIPYFVFHDLDYAKTKDGKSTNVWKINESIWKEIEEASSLGIKVGRCVFEHNFEEAHYDSSKSDKSAGKPYVAWQESQRWSNEWENARDISKLSGKYPIVKSLEKILLDRWDDLDIHDQKWVESKEKEAPNDFCDEVQLPLF